MKIEIKDIAEKDRGKIKRALKGAFPIAPAVTIRDTRPVVNPNAAVPVIVTNGPSGKSERESIEAAIDGTLMRNGHRFCNITFR